MVSKSIILRFFLSRFKIKNWNICVLV